jgi:hypothetical protein
MPVQGGILMEGYVIFKLVSGLVIYGLIGYGVFREIQRLARWIKDARR